ncbi:MAG: hypothetical protein WBA06_03555 [Candidatus Aquilonibacter sp.]
MAFASSLCVLYGTLLLLAATSTTGVSPAAMSTPSLYIGYAAIDVRSKYAPAFGHQHQREILDSLHSVKPADRGKVRYTIAFMSPQRPKIFIIFFADPDVGARNQGLSQYYPILNLPSAANYDPSTNTIVPQPP